ncbi:hypothetical protein C2845_PM06G28470 [Panicum miliaceum]|uniref:Uncharacterized protein n=1 Tax=Panicum miliaceum TaxID=4540 RepID=A0A3L6R5L2_PANMI|nr:hypothetical protein C2845_PM06G28470 [Panicum miliaceum]
MHVEKWEKLRDSMGYELETNPTLKWTRHVLNLSYNDLPHHLKTCLLYFGIYPEDHKIDRFDLVRQWIAEGFVPEEHGLNLEDVAEGYFNELVNRCMIQPVTYHLGEMLGEVLSCRVHDLMLDLILSKGTEENFITTNGCPHNMNGTSQVRRISHQFHTRNMAPAVERMNLSQLRSYMFYPAAKCVLVLSKFELLRVLHLEIGYYGGHDSECLDLSNSISHLFLFWYLKVRGFRLKLPKKFGKLQHLMTLDLAANWLDSSNPTLDVTSLSSLRHLILPCDPTCLELRNGVSKLSNLQTLLCFDISMNSVETIRDLSELTNLRELLLTASGGFRDEDSETKTLKYDTLAASLVMLGNSNLHWLSINFSTPEQFWNYCLACPHHLQLIWCNNMKTPQVPKWMAQADRLAYLEELKVEQLLSEDVRVLAQMPCLGFLCLQAKMVPEKCIIIHSNAFPILKEFIFNYKLSCLTFEPGAMPRLKKLDISYDSRGPGSEHEVSPVAGVEHLASLEEVSVVVYAKRGEGSNFESLYRESIQRHPRYQSINIDVRISRGRR